MPEIEIIISRDGEVTKKTNNGPDNGIEPQTNTSTRWGKLIFPPDGYPDRPNLAGDDFGCGGQ